MVITPHIMEQKNLKIQIEDAARHALKNREELLLSTLRMLLSAIHGKEIEKRSKTGASVLGDEEILAVIRSEAKKRKDAALEFEKAGRAELAEKEKMEQAMLASYLPPEMTDEEIKNLLTPLAPGATIKDFGKVMSAAMKAVAGRTSGERVSEAVKRMLTE